MAGKEMYSGGQKEKGFIDTSAWYATRVGYGAAIIGAFVAPALVVPGLLLGTGGLIAENRPKSGK